MKNSLHVLFAIVGLTCISSLSPSTAGAVEPADIAKLNALAIDVASEDAAKSAEAVAQLRAAGPQGLDAMLRIYGDRLQPPQKQDSANDEPWERLRTALDTIGQQRDCYASRLYWFTDLEKAKEAARASGKPILSLRLLGKLNEEYSCANSRFFRTTLYPNAEVSAYLREHFILHWQSVRPVPRITIDMGDGRRIERTITGNSIHYVLDADGNPIDALPGLYGARTFVDELGRAIAAEQQASKLSGEARAAYLRSYHSDRYDMIQKEWARDLVAIGQMHPPSMKTGAFGGPPDAIAAAPASRSKATLEVPLLRAGAETAFTTDRDRLDALSDDAIWRRLGALHGNDARLDAATRKLIEFKQPPSALNASRATLTKAAVESPMLRMVHNLERSIAEDTIRNEYQLHSRIHQWFANGEVPANLEALNSKVYASLFLTPNWDAWLGLVPSDTFSALDHGGLIEAKAH